jgi:hypothetical protein
MTKKKKFFTGNRKVTNYFKKKMISEILKKFKNLISFYNVLL